MGGSYIAGQLGSSYTSLVVGSVEAVQGLILEPPRSKLDLNPLGADAVNGKVCRSTLVAH